VEVEEIGVDLDEIAGRTRAQRGLGKRLAQAGDVRLDHLDRRLGRLDAPQAVNEPVHGDDPVQIEQEQREQRPLLRRAQRNGLFPVHDLERAEDPIFHGRAERSTSNFPVHSGRWHEGRRRPG
jgi:hypothetical protein